MKWFDFNEQLLLESGMTRERYDSLIGLIDVSLTDDLPWFKQLPVTQQQELMRWVFRQKFMDPE